VTPPLPRELFDVEHRFFDLEGTRVVEASLPKVGDRPTLIVLGATDLAFGEGERKRFEATFPNHRTILFDNASHFLQEDVGERIAEAFKSFRGESGE
jgi:haloalkane dehalogenase